MSTKENTPSSGTPILGHATGIPGPNPAEARRILDEIKSSKKPEEPKGPEGLSVGRVVHYHPFNAGMPLIGGRVSHIYDREKGDVHIHLDTVPGIHHAHPSHVQAPYSPDGRVGTWRYPPRA